MKKSEYWAKLTIKVDDDTLSGTEFDQLCSILRGLFYSNGKSKGQTLKNNQFRVGTIVEFGAAPMAREFKKSVLRFLKKSIVKKIDLTLGP